MFWIRAFGKKKNGWTEDLTIDVFGWRRKREIVPVSDRPDTIPSAKGSSAVSNDPSFGDLSFASVYKPKKREITYKRHFDIQVSVWLRVINDVRNIFKWTVLFTRWFFPFYTDLFTLLSFGPLSLHVLITN